MYYQNLRMILHNRIPTLTEEELTIIVDMFYFLDRGIPYNIIA
jgi:hypothetical protein